MSNKAVIILFVDNDKNQTTEVKALTKLGYEIFTDQGFRALTNSLSSQEPLSDILKALPAILSDETIWVTKQ